MPAVAMPVDNGTTVRPETPQLEKLKQHIRALAKRKNAVIISHIYQRLEVQEVSDFIGDSLNLSREAARTKADVI
ncbi:MAG TPA: quinolinate synthase NadA, partial [Candidatus Eremiobacteraceae bacterium]|nr:quinolinate synthase NadA [Candidatus Eremiobacteraceae bacterium]